MSGTPMVDIGKRPSGSPTYPLDVAAALSNDRKTFIFSIVNPTEQAHEFTPRISGVKLRGAGRLSQIAPPSVSSNNQAGKDPMVTIVESPQTELAERVQVPPVSVSIYEFAIA
jgi:alpha-N-arabinofuranosidase